MIKRTAMVNLSLAAGKFSADPNDYVWFLLLEDMPVEIRSFTGPPLKREDGSDWVFEATITIPFLFNDAALLLQTSRELRLLVEWDFFPGVFPPKNYVGIVTGYYDRYLTLAANPWEAPV